MLGVHARFAALGIASAIGASAAFAGCALQTSGLAAGEAGGGSTSATTMDTGGQADAGHADAGHDGGHDAGGHDAGGHDDGGSVDAAPVDSGPTALASCKDWLAANPAAASGVYQLVDGMGNVYEAYCHMDCDDGGDTGGWTLALKIDGTILGTLYYGDALWTNATALNPDKPDLDMNEAKLASFWSVPLTELRVGMNESGTTRWLIVPLPVPGGVPASLLNLVTMGSNAPQTNLGRAAWEGLLSNGSLQTQCKWEGINANGMIRIGIVDDESGDCQSPDSFLGFGALPASSNQFQSPSPPSGNIAEYSPDNGNQTTTTFGYVMVR